MVLTMEGEFYSAKSLRTIRQQTSRIEEYCGRVDMSAINFEWTEEYRFYLLEKGYAKNTVSVLMSRLRFWIRYFHKLGMMPYSGAGIRTAIELTTAVFNTVEELKILRALELPAGKRKVRDLYICQCFMGLRFSDMFHFAKNIETYKTNIGGKIFFEMRTSKTGEVVVIPAADIVLEILEEYDNNFGSALSNWYYSRTIKEIVKNSEIDRDIMFYRTEGGEKTEKVLRFWQLVSSHTARRTFASNAYISGIDPLDIMKITGHRSYNSFFKYIRCENKAVALRIADHDFFHTDFSKP